MKLKNLVEKTKQNGTYVGLKFHADDENKILDLIKRLNIKKPIPIKDIHVTLLYSDKNLPDYKPLKELNIPVYPKKFHIFNGETNILVLKLESEPLIKRHNYLKSEHNTTHNFPNYDPHITLSYDYNDLDIDELNKKFKKIIPEKLTIISEYKEDLDPDWEKKIDND